MSLRTQLLLVSLLTLALPWAGCQYVKEMEAVLRQGQSGALMATARAVSHVLSTEADTLYRHPEHRTQLGDTDLDVYAHALTEPVNVDGFHDEWHALENDWVTFAPRSVIDPYPNLPLSAGQVRALAGVRDGFLYLFFSVDVSASVDYHNPTRRGIANGEHVILHIGDSGSATKRYWLRTAAPGELTAVRLKRSGRRQLVVGERRIKANWQAHTRGFQLEAQIPRAMLGAEFGFSIVDMQTDASGKALAKGWFGTVPPDMPPDYSTLGFLIHPSTRVSQLLEPFWQPGMLIRVTDRAGRILGETGNLAAQDRDLTPDQVWWRPRLHQLYRSILDTLPRDDAAVFKQQGQLQGPLIENALLGQEQSAWRRQAGARTAVVAAVHPLHTDQQILGSVVLEQSSASVLALSNDAITGLFNTTFLAMVLAAAGLLGFATILSIRIRRLRDAAERSVTAEGRIEGDLIQARATDELGDLSRSFSGLLKRLDDYNHYLQTLASKLSHELRTPLAVVNSSLENLEQEALSAQARTCSRRAREGASRLRSILAALSEATRVEQSIQAAEPEIFDLREVVEGSVLGYRGVYTGHFFDTQTPDAACMMSGSPDLIVQMLDKLVENAADFCPPAGSIRISLRAENEGFRLCVANDGPALPARMQGQLFDQLVSVRETRGDSPHLGLGLHIVKLIVDHHDGNISAENMPADLGVEFRIALPSGL